MIIALLNVIGINAGTPGSGPTPPPLFPCTITAGTTYTLSADVITDCDPILIENS